MAELAINKLIKNLSLLKPQFSKQPIVLITNGSMNPIHKQHIAILETAKKSIERENPNFKVVAGYIGLNSDHSVKKKLKNEAIGIDTRAKLVELATEDSEWIDLERWELNFSKPYSISKHLANYLNSHPKILKYNKKWNSSNDGLGIDETVKVMYVVGSDAVVKYHSYEVGSEEAKKASVKLAKAIQDDITMLIIDRQTKGERDFADWKNQFKKCLNDGIGKGKWNNHIIFIENDDELKKEISSTKIRKAYKEKDKEYLIRVMHPKVLEYIEKNGLFGNNLNQTNHSRQERERERESLWKQPNTYLIFASGIVMSYLVLGIYWIFKKNSPNFNKKRPPIKRGN